MFKTSGSLLLFILLVVGTNAQFNPRFFMPHLFPSSQQNMNSFSEFGAFGLPQMPAFGPSRFGMSQSPYGSPLFNSNYESSFFNSNNINDLIIQDQQMFGQNASPFYRRPSFAQFEVGSSMPSGSMTQGLPPAFVHLPPGFINNPVGGKAPYQRTLGMETNLGNQVPPTFSGLESFQTSASDSKKVNQ